GKTSKSNTVARPFASLRVTNCEGTRPLLCIGGLELFVKVAGDDVIENHVDVFHRPVAARRYDERHVRQLRELATGKAAQTEHGQSHLLRHFDGGDDVWGITGRGDSDEHVVALAEIFQWFAEDAVV